MHKETIKRVIRSQIIMLSPICTHWCENIWRNVLKEEGSVTKADWPLLSAMNTDDSVVMLQANYLDDIVEIFKERRIKAKKKKKKGKKKSGSDTATGETKEDGPPTRGIIYIQTTYPKWRETILTFLSSKWDGVKRTFGEGKKKEETNGFTVCKKDIMMEIMKMTATDDSLKEQGKKLNKVVAFCMAAAEKRGKTALGLKSPFDESKTIEEFRVFLASTLELPNGITVVIDSTEEVAADAEPGIPVLVEMA
jgi:leucyl-tRNA synthetase